MENITMFGITGTPYYVLSADLATGELYYMQELMPDDIIGCTLELDFEVEKTINDLEDFKSAVYYLLESSFMNPIGFYEEPTKDFEGKYLHPGIFIGNYEGINEEHQQEILKEIKETRYR